MQTIILFSLLALAVAAWAWEIYTREADLCYNLPSGDKNVQTLVLHYWVQQTVVYKTALPCGLVSAMVSLATSSLVWSLFAGALTLDGGDSGSLDHEMEFQSIRCQLPGTMVPSIQRPAHLLHHYCRGWNKLSFYNTTITEIQRYAVHTFGSGYQWLLAESAPGLWCAVQCALQ